MRGSRYQSLTVNGRVRMSGEAEGPRVSEGSAPASAVIAEARPLQSSSIFRLAFAVALLATGFFLAAAQAQAPGGPPGAESPPPASPRTFLAPTNLQVLPKDLSGQQVHDIMEQWAGSLGARCNACHVEDTENAEPDGRPHLDFSDDFKPMKSVARRMYAMTEEINRNYLAKVNDSGKLVTCGTCHRGRVSPEPFTVPAGEQPPAQAPQSVKESR